MGRVSTLLISTGSLLLGGVAVAQQGMIVEPWQTLHSQSAPALVPVASAMPASGLDPIEAAASAPVAARIEPAAGT